MANAYKNLGQLAPAAATLSDLYTAASAAIGSSLVVCNRGRAVSRFRVAHAVAGAADEIKQYLAYDIEVPAGESYIFTVGLTFAATDILRVYADSADLSFNLYGQEIT